MQLILINISLLNDIAQAEFFNPLDGETIIMTITTTKVFYLLGKYKPVNEIKKSNGTIWVFQN